MDRRLFLAVTGSLAFSGTLLPGALYALAATPSADGGVQPITPEMVDAAAALAGVPMTAAQRQMMLDGLTQNRRDFSEIRKLAIPNSVAPAYVFDPLPAGALLDTQRRAAVFSKPEAMDAPHDLEALAFASVMELAGLMRRRRITSVALTQMYLARLKRYDPTLHFLVTLTEERALAQAHEADADIARGHYRGPLHGLPWGAKDLLAVKGYPTTWGAGGFEHQSFDDDATVVKRLDAAGAVLVAKLTLGALAMGDVWFGGRTRNPWNTKQGSSGSSAGPASATAAGCVAFSVGSETLGSISSPSTRCGATGLRPTFGFVPRTGAMALSWTMDKLGPICRAVEDCAAVMEAIHGPDGQDRTVREAAFGWDAGFDWKTLRVGYIASEFAEAKPSGDPKQKDAEARTAYDHRFDAAALSKLRAMGLTLQPVELPALPYGAMAPLLTAEAAAAFDSLTMTGRDSLLTAQGPEDWPNDFRIARLYPAVEYIQANRARMLAMEGMAKLFEQVDVIVAASGSVQLVATNLTGHPAVIVPNGMRGADAPAPPATDAGDDDSIGGPGTPVSLTFLGGLYGDAKALALARAYQQATGFHTLHPKL